MARHGRRTGRSTATILEPLPAPAVLDDNRKHRKLGLILLCFALLGGGLLRGVQAGAKRRLECDEGISFTVATGHRAEYQRIVTERSHPYGKWVPSAEWQRLIRVEKPFCFRQIGADLAQFDIHPPFYFWLLHLWMMVVGVHIWTGPALNTLIAMGTMIVLFLLGRQAIGTAIGGGAAAFIWAFSPTVILASNEARQYDCLGFCTALLAWLALGCVDIERRCGWKSLIMLGGATVIGLLTYYHIALFIFACVMLFAICLLRKHRSRFLACCASVGVGALVFALLHPRFMESLDRGRARMQSTWKLDDLSFRVEQVITRYASFIVGTRLYSNGVRALLEYIVWGAFILLVVATLIVYTRSTVRRATRRGLVDHRVIHVLFLFAFAAGSNVLMYLTGMSPAHAMEPKHPSMVYPMLSLAIVTMIWSFRRVRKVVLPLLCCVLLGTSVHSVYSTLALNDKTLDLAQVMKHANAIVIDNPSLLFVPALAVHAPDHVPMLVAYQDDLLNRQTQWPAGLGSRSLYISWPENEAGVERGNRILQSLTGDFDVAVAARRLVGWRGTLVRLKQRRASS